MKVENNEITFETQGEIHFLRHLLAIAEIYGDVWETFYEEVYGKHLSMSDIAEGGNFEYLSEETRYFDQFMKAITANDSSIDPSGSLREVSDGESLGFLIKGVSKRAILELVK